MRRFLIALLLALMAATPATGGSPRGWSAWNTPAFAALPDGTDLPHPTTTAIVQDRQGFIWIGTRGGLARYDGQRVLAFKQNAAEPDGLSDNYVRSLLALPDGNLLVGTNVGGLMRFDPATNRFTALGAGVRDFAERIMGLAPDISGGAWVASYRGVYHVEAGTGAIRHVWQGDGDSGGAFAVFQDADGTLWIGSDKGLLVRRPGKRHAVPVRATGPAAAILKDSDIWAIRRDEKGRLWVGTGSRGVVRLSGNHAIQPRGLNAASPFVSHRTIRSFMRDPASDGMLVATDGIGLILASDDGRDPVSLRHDPQQNLSLPGDAVRDLFVDRNGGLWVATDLGPARRLAHSRTAFTMASGMADTRLSLSANDVRGLMIDTRGRVWAGLDNGRIDVIDREARSVRHIVLTGRYAGQDVKAIAQGPDGTVYAGSRGVVAVDPDTGDWRGLKVAGVDGTSVISLATLGRKILIGTYNGLFVLDGRSGSVKHYTQQEGQRGGLPNNEVINITALGDEIWLSTSRGISRFDPAKESFENFSNRPGDADSLPQDYTNSILMSGGRLWVGTFGGVAHADPNVRPLRFRTITDANGLAGNDISSLIADSKGRIWAASSRGLSVIDPRTGAIRSASFVDGMPDTTFNRRTVARDAAGNLLFGGTAGLTIVQPQARAPSGASARDLAPTTLEMDGKSMPFAGLRDGKLPELVADSRGFRLGFALLDYEAPGDIRYSYRLDGFDEGWIAVPADTPAIAAYTNLAGGDYTLHLRAEVPGLEARVFERSLALTVAPFWYQTWWARAGIALAAIGLVFALIQLRTRVILGKARQLERTIAERTGELVAANALLERLATTDALTGLLNRRSLMAAIETERERAARGGRTFALVLADIDRFKSINDTHGHGAGDAVLKSVAATLTGQVRSIDHVARLGGEEFVILLPECDADHAAIMAERLRAAVADHAIATDEADLRITVSIGVTTWRAGEDAGTILNRADRAMYAAKRGGRNAVEIATYDETLSAVA